MVSLKISLSFQIVKYFVLFFFFSYLPAICFKIAGLLYICRISKHMTRLLIFIFYFFVIFPVKRLGKIPTTYFTIKATPKAFMNPLVQFCVQVFPTWRHKLGRSLSEAVISKLRRWRFRLFIKSSITCTSYVCIHFYFLPA